MSEVPVTKCEGCIFSELEGDKQVGCDLKRHEKLGVSTLSDDSSFTLKRFCNAYRPDEWVSSLDFSERLEPVETVMKEISPRVGFVIKLDHKRNDEINDLNKTLESIKALPSRNDEEHAYVTVINEKVEFNEEIWGRFITYFGEDPKTKYHIVQINSAHKELETMIDEAFGHSQNGWVHCLTAGDEVPDDFLNRIHHFINVEMKMLVLLLPKSDNPFTGLTFPAFLFKFLNGNGTKIFKDEMVDTRGFITKVLEAEKRGGTKTVYTWEEFNAS